jgi:hypothetical protein
MSSGTTAVYALHYPIQTDAVDVAADVQLLATDVETQLLLKAPILSPTFTGVPLSTTPADSDSSTKIATTAFVKNQGYSIVASPTFTGTVTIPTLSVTGSATITSTISASGLAGSLLTSTVGSTLGVAAAGTSTIPARSDHVHPTEIPTQTGNGGKFLSTDGSAVSWATVIGSVYQASAPSSPSTGAIWTNSNNNVFYQYNGTSWISPMGIEPFTPTFTTNNYTMVLADQARLLQLGNGVTAGTLTVPTNTSVAYPIGTQIQLVQINAGQITLAPASITTATYASGGAAAATTFVISTTNANIAINQLVTGTGFAANTLVTNVSGTTITVSPAISSQVSGTITFSVGLVATPGLKLRTQWSSVTLIKTNTNSWIAIGDLSS